MCHKEPHIHNYIYSYSCVIQASHPIRKQTVSSLTSVTTPLYNYLLSTPHSIISGWICLSSGKRHKENKNALGLARKLPLEYAMQVIWKMADMLELNCRTLMIRKWASDNVQWKWRETKQLQCWVKTLVLVGDIWGAFWFDNQMDDTLSFRHTFSSLVMVDEFCLTSRRGI